MRSLIPLAMIGFLGLAACGSEDHPGTPTPGPLAYYPAEFRFVNVDDESLLVVGIQARLILPDEPAPILLVRNWQRPGPGDELVLACPDSIPAGTLVQAWYLVLAHWGHQDPDASWRAWASDPDTVRERTDAALLFRWPQDRFDFNEVAWPPTGNEP